MSEAIAIVVPVRNEERQVGAFVAELRRVVGTDAQILFVDDGSTDGTWAAIRGMSEEDAKVGGVRLSRNFGKEAAVWAGLEAANGAAAVVVMDVDFQHPPELVPQMIEQWRTGRYRIIEARKKQRGREPWLYRMFSALFYWVLRMGTRIDFRGSTDFKLLDRSVVELLSRFRERVTFFRGITAWTGIDRAVLEFDVPDAGRPSRWNVRRLIKFSIDAITSFTPWPLFLVAFGGVVFAVFAAILGIETLYMFFSGRAFTGFTTVILLILIVGAAIMLGMAILGLYVSRLFEEVKGRPRSVVTEKLIR